MGLFACASEYKKDDDTLVIDGGDMLQGSAYATTAEIFLETANILRRWQMTVDMTSIRLEIMILTMVRNIRLFTAITNKVLVYVRMCLTAREIFFIRI